MGVTHLRGRFFEVAAADDDAVPQWPQCGVRPNGGVTNASAVVLQRTATAARLVARNTRGGAIAR